RLMFIIMISTIMTLTTSPLDLTDAFEMLLYTLKLIKIPVHLLSMMMSIALRFIPTLMNELDKIILAQKSRGSEISSGGLINRVKAFIPLLVPLFISAFQRAEDLAIAMEVRGYETNKKRTSYRKLYWRWADSLLLMLIVQIAIILFILMHIGVKRMVRVLVNISYQDSQFLGFQIQDNGRTVQQQFEKILKRMHKRHVRIHPTSRTDRGVHAFEQYFHFDSELNISADQWQYAMNRALPDDIFVKHVSDRK